MVESTPIPRIYLDVCCLNRSFDDQRQDRIRLEAEAVLLILGRCETSVWQWLSSAVVEEEVNNTPSSEAGPVSGRCSAGHMAQSR